MAVQDIINRLEHYREVHEGQWIARCPAHDDRSPSLGIKSLDDGRVLINCLAGCGAADVLDAVGLEFSALFPPGETHVPPIYRKRRYKSEDELVLEIAAADRRKGRELNEADEQRELEAFLRLGSGHKSPDEPRQAAEKRMDKVMERIAKEAESHIKSQHILQRFDAAVERGHSFTDSDYEVAGSAAMEIASNRVKR